MSSNSDASSSKPLSTRRTSARKQSLNVRQTQPKASPDSSSRSPRTAAASNSWKQVKLDHAKDVEETLLAQCESYYQLMLQRLSGSSTKEAEQTISDAMSPLNSSATSLDLVHKCSRVGSRYQADIPSKLPINQHLADLTRFPEYAEPLIRPEYWAQTVDQLNQSSSNANADITIRHINSSNISNASSLSLLSSSSSSLPSNDHTQHSLCNGVFTLGKHTLTREQEYRVRYLNSSPAFPAFEFVRSKLCSPLSLKHRTEVLHKRAQGAEARLKSARTAGGRGRRSTRINPELAPPPPAPKPNVIDVAKQLPVVWERMLNTGGQLKSGDGRSKLASLVHEVMNERSVIDMNTEPEVVEQPAIDVRPSPGKGRPKKQRLT